MSHGDQLTASTDGDVGVIESHGSHSRVSIRRRYRATSDRVWAALTLTHELRGWLAPTPIFELRPGGRAVFAFENDEVCRATVLEFQPLRQLVLTWDFPGEGVSKVSFELRSDGEDTVLQLNHDELSTAHAASYGAGWDAHLGALEAHLTGEGFSYAERYRELLPGYEATLEGSQNL